MVATIIRRSYWLVVTCVMRTVILEQIPSFLHSHGEWYGDAGKVDIYTSRATGTSFIYFVLLLFSFFLVKRHWKIDSISCSVLNKNFMEII